MFCTAYSSLSLTSLIFATIYLKVSVGPAIAVNISWSLSIPRALISKTTGIGVVPAVLILTINIPSLRFSTVSGFLIPSFWENILATSVLLAYLLLISTVTLFGAKSSVEISTLSVPLIMK